MLCSSLGLAGAGPCGLSLRHLHASAPVPIPTPFSPPPAQRLGHFLGLMERPAASVIIWELAPWEKGCGSQVKREQEVEKIGRWEK